MIRNTASAFLFTTVLSLHSLPGGVVFQIESKDVGGNDSELLESVVEGTNLKMEIGSGNRNSEGTMIFRGEQRRMLVVDHDTRSYMVMDQAAISAIGDQMNQAMRQMEEGFEALEELNLDLDDFEIDLDDFDIDLDDFDIDLETDT